MSFVVVLPVAPVIADDAGASRGRGPRRRSPRARRAGRSGTSAAAAPRASACATKSAPARRRRRRGRPPRSGASRSARRSPRSPTAARAAGRAARSASSSSGITARATTRCSASRATSRSSNGIFPVASSCSGSAPRPAITTTSPGRALAERELDRGAPVELDLERAERAGGDLGGDRGGLLAARVVGGEDRAVGELGDDATHQRPLRRGRGRRRRRRRRRAARRRARARRGARCRASRACARSRRSP